MTGPRTGDDAIGRKRNWRHRETRVSSKLVAKRVSEDDHEVLTRYAASRGVKVAELLAPAVDELIQQARAFCNESDSPTVRAS